MSFFPLKRSKNELGKRYGHLTVVAKASNQEFPEEQSKTLWVCQCDCGREGCRGTVEVFGYQLRRGVVKSCGGRRYDGT
jgi:hypothetical protein